MGAAQSKASRLRWLVLPLFLVSGATGLIYEITWMRALGAVFGNTVFAGSTVLTAFMLGLALGSLLLGRKADRSLRPLAWYAALELAIGLYAIAFPFILQGVDRFYEWFYQTASPSFTVLTVVRFTVSIIILLIPTLLMGGTLPMLSTLWTASSNHKMGQSIGVLYALNTFGAVVGCFATGYFLIRLLGVTESITLAAILNIAIALLAWLISLGIGKRDLVQTAKSTSAMPCEVSPHHKLILATVFTAGFCSLALEVLWTRILVFVLETSAYAFSCMLTCFILGLGFGSLFASKLLIPRLKRPLLALGMIECALAVSVVASIPVLSLLWHIDLLIITQLSASSTSFVLNMIAHFVDTLIVIFPSTFLMGMVFPLAIEVCSPAQHTVGQRVGQVYAWNTLGCVLGSFMAGFVFIPQFGIRHSFLGVICILVVLSIVILVQSKSPKWITGILSTTGIGLAVICLVLVPKDVFVRTMNTYHNPSDIIYMHDGVTGTVTVHDLPDGDRLIAVDGVDVAGMDLMLRTTQKLQAYAPLLVHDNPQDVVQIGYGSGETCGIGLDFGVKNYTIVDVCPGIFTAGKYFESINRRSFDNPKLRKVIMDGKNFIKLTNEKFDIIMNDSTYPGTTGSSALYTYDHFLACREHLKPGGVLSCWVPLDLRPEDLRIIVRSFQAAMPHSSLWMVNNCLNKHAVFLGTLEPMAMDFKRIASLVSRDDLAPDLQAISIYTAYDFLDCMSVNPEGMKHLGGDGPLHTDNHPHLEFGAAIKRDVEGCWRDIMYGIGQSQGPVLPYVTNLPAKDDRGDDPKIVFDRYHKASKFTFLGVVGMLEGNPQLMKKAFETAKQANPYDLDIDSILKEMVQEIAALEQELYKAPDKTDLRQRLAKRYLLLEQYDLAAKQYELYLKSTPTDAAAWNQLGLSYQYAGQTDQAKHAFTQAIQHNPTLKAAHVNLANLSKQASEGATLPRDN